MLFHVVILALYVTHKVDMTFLDLAWAYIALRVAHSVIDFFPSGMSCGGVLALARPGMGFEVRVNWLTGGVDIVPQKLL